MSKLAKWIILTIIVIATALIFWAFNAVFHHIATFIIMWIVTFLSIIAEIVRNNKKKKNKYVIDITTSSNSELTISEAKKRKIQELIKKIEKLS